MRISDWSSDVCSSDPAWRGADRSSPTVVAVAPTRPRSHRDHRPCGRGLWHLHLDPLPGVARAEPPQVGAPVRPWCDAGCPAGRDGALRRDRRRTEDQDHQQEGPARRSEEHTSELQSLMRISYAVFCLKKKTNYI